jgi:transcriptional accessory protein Tex/SPT6
MKDGHCGVVTYSDEDEIYDEIYEDGNGFYNEMLEACDPKRQVTITVNSSGVVSYFDEDEIYEGMEVECKILKVVAWGAFVDIGTRRKAFLHVTEMPEEENYLRNLETGQNVKCRIKKLDSMRNHKIWVTCKEFDKARTPFNFLEVGEEVRGKVVSVSRHGAFLDIGARSAGYVRASDVMGGWVPDFTKEVEVGDILTRCFIRKVNEEEQQVYLGCSKDIGIMRGGRGDWRGQKLRRGRRSSKDTGVMRGGRGDKRVQKLRSKTRGRRTKRRRYDRE